MKQTKKLFSAVLAIVLAFAMMIPAFAANWTGSITINGTETVPATGKTFTAYKILDAKAVNESNLDDGVVYSIPEEMQSFYNTLLNKEENVNATVDEVIAYIDADTTDLQEFAVEALAAAKTANADKKSAVGADNKAVIEGLEFGYYVVEDEGTATPISALMLRSSSAEVTIKADKPSIEKKIDGATDNDNTTSGLVDYNTATVGETVPYVLTSKVPVMTGYTSYTYVVTDTLSDGLTFVDSETDNDEIVDVVVTVDGVAYENVTVAQNGQTMTITFNNFLELADKAGKEIKITYAAKVNSNAVVGVEGNPNKVNLTYSNNPQDEESKETTLDDITRTYLVDLIINKTDGEGTPLAGAGFTVYHGSTPIATGTSDENGKVTFTWTNGVGLKDGEEYTISETTVPAGYNKAADITFTVTCTDPVADATSQNCTWSSDNASVTFTATEGTANDYFETTIENLTGNLLPETGGMGTTMFYIIGAMMVIGAAVIMVSKKRMAFEA